MSHSGPKWHWAWVTSTTQWEGSVHSQAEQGTVVPKDPLCRYVGTGVMTHEVLHSSSSLWTLVGLELDRLLPGGLPWWFIWLKKGKTFWTVKEELQHSNHGSPKEYNILQVPTQCSSLYLLIFSSFREKALSRSGRRSISHWRWGGFGKVWKHFRLSQCGLGLLLASTELRQGCANHPTMYKTAPTSKDYLASN